MKNSKNPWEGMEPARRRRVNELYKKFECYWVTGYDGKYGFLIESKDFFDAKTKKIKLKGITVINENTDDSSSLLLFLKKKEDWDLFLDLCNSLSSASNISAVQVRLGRWQKFLQRERNKAMTREMQMGLFTELACLKEVLEPKIGIKQAINAWVGPDSDKQDFLLDDFILEIKSYRTSKTPVAHISSAGQLYSEKEPIYVILYALMDSEKGASISDLIDEIELIISEDEINEELIEVFNSKLDNYGYIPDFDNETSLIKFKIDNSSVYHVTDDFPKLTPLDIPLQITSLQYGIDLSKCSDYLVNIEDIMGEVKNG